MKASAVALVLILFGGLIISLIARNSIDTLAEKNRKQNKNQYIVFAGQEIKKDGIFTFSPEDDCVMDSKAKLKTIGEDFITIERFEYLGFDQKTWVPEKDIFPETIKDRSCLFAPPRCLDVSYKYCFRIKKEGEKVSVNYTLESESTMPLPIE